MMECICPRWPRFWLGEHHHELCPYWWLEREQR